LEKATLATFFVITIGSSACLILTLVVAALLSSFPIKNTAENDIALINSAEPEINESALNGTEQIMKNSLQNLSLINAIILSLMIPSALMGSLLLLYRKYLRNLKFTSKLSTAASVTIVISFGLMVLFYTSADHTNMIKEQTTTQMLSVIMGNDKDQDKKIELLNQFIINTLNKYRQDIINSIFFGFTTLLVGISWLWHKVNPQSISPHFLFCIIIGSILIWSVMYLIQIPPPNPPFVSCIKIHC